MEDSKARFRDAKACFLENMEHLPQPNPAMPKTVSQLWILSKGLYDLTTAIEHRFEELEAQLRT
jgi:hypothetical protein